MKKKRDNCKYCDEPMDAKTTRKEFCSVKCKVYWHRDNEPKKVAPKEEKKKLEEEKKDLSDVKVDLSEVKKYPKTLDELKSMCPPELTGLDKSAWVATERQKYGI